MHCRRDSKDTSVQSLARWAGVLVAAAILLTLGWPCYGSSVDVHQIDWFNGVTGAAPLANTTWGQAVIDVTPGASAQFVNIVAQDAGNTWHWLAQNVPVMPTTVTPVSAPAAINMDLGKIGIASGTPAAGTSFHYTIGGFETVMPVGGFTGSGFISSSPVVYDYGFDFHDLGDDMTIDVDPTGMTPLTDPVLIDPGAAPNPTLPQVPPPPPPPVLVYRANMTAAEQGVNECAPGSAANSLQWLHDEYGYDLGGKTLQQVHDDLVAKMKTDPATGTSIDDFLAGKQEAAGDLNLKSFRGKVTWDWIEAEIDHGEDVELWYAWWGKVKYKDAAGVEKEKWQWNGHAVTIQGKYDDGVNRWLWVRDDWNQGAAGGTSIPRWTRVGSQFAGRLSLLDESKYTHVYFAHSESIPEPFTMATGMIALTLVAGYLHKRKAERLSE